VTALDPRTPVIIGVGQYVHRAATLAEGVEPVELMERAVSAAVGDAGLDGPPAADAVRVVGQLSWRYGNTPRMLAERLGLSPARLDYTTMGGNSPQSLVNATALDIQAGQIDVAVLSGGEATRTRSRARKAGVELHWPKSPVGDEPTIVGEDLEMNLPAEIDRGIYLPVQIYPMFETAIRAAAGRSVEQHRQHLGRLWSDLSEVAARNPYAWTREARTPHEIITVTDTNRMIGLPYPKLMNSNNDVDMGAAVIMCSVEAAQRLGVAADRWVFPHAGTDCHEHPTCRIGTRSPTPRRSRSADGRSSSSPASASTTSRSSTCTPAFRPAVQLGAASLGVDTTQRQTRRAPAVSRSPVDRGTTT
jgi:acetyl-CoA C-acetyltransferase